MPSTRRRFLLSAALAASLGGCAASESPDSGDTTVEMTRVETTATSPRATGTTATGEATAEETTAVEPRREPPESEAVRWRVALDAPVEFRLALGGDRVYVPVGDPKYGSGEETVGAFAALDRGDGTPRWTAALADAPTGSPSVRDGRAYCTIGGSDGLGLHGRDQRLVGFSRSGDERWRTESVDSFLDLVAVGDDAYVATRDDVLDSDGETLSAVGLSSGRTRWSVESGDVGAGRERNGTLLLEVAGGMGVAVHDAATGERRWAASGSPVGTPTTPVSVADDAVFVCGPGDRNEFVALELADGSERWRYAMDIDGRFVPTAGGTGDDTVVGVEYDGRLFGLDATDGTERWTFDSGGRGGPPILDDGTVYVGGGSDESAALYALDAATGDEKWRLDGPSVAPFDTTGEALLVRGSDGPRNVVAALDPEDGTRRWSFETEESLTLPVVADGSVYVVGETGVVRALGE